MASSPSTVAWFEEQMARGNAVRTRRMFGEYGVYCDERFVEIIAEDRLYLKITDAGRALVPEAEEGFPYPRASPHLIIDEVVIEDADRLSALVRATARALPPPQPKRR